MIRIEVATQSRTLQTLERFIQATPRRFQAEIARRVMPALKRALLPPLRKPQRLPRLPFVWSHNPVKQARARAYYFAVKVPRGSKGGRYKRTGRLAASWNVEHVIERGALVLINDAPGAAYVQGDRQVPSHKDTGYMTAKEAIARVNLLSLVRQSWQSASTEGR